ncbi:hypothetical protein ACFQGT_07980 [Natrialbaceae archaeon GCM10025810]|uniref:DUF7382 domain-containing protein n=1 Tax=Halovalidus salilacus TaxID=3075124 RepID=UPI00361F535C
MRSDTNRENGPAERGWAASRPFASDDRAIEGLPVRLVIALVVGVAALGLMMNMLGDIGDIGQNELSVEWEDEPIVEEGDRGDLSHAVVDEDGNEIEDYTLIVTSGSASLDSPERIADDEDVDVSDADLRQDADIGTLEVEIVPPSDGNFVDEQENAEITIIES